MSTREKTDGLPVTAPTKSWYKNPMIIMGISMGGIFAFCIPLVVILVILTRKWKRKAKVDVSSPYTLRSRLVGITGSAENSHRPAPDGIVIEDLEMKNLESVLLEDNSK